MGRLTRRRFMARVSSGALAVLPAALGLKLVGDVLWPAPLDQRIAAMFSNLDSARRVGAAYLRSHPHETRHRLLAHLGALEGALGSSGSRGGLGRRLDAAIRADFAAGRIVKVDGWILALTEARACAVLVARG